MKLWAISDLHLSSQVNRDALEDIADHGEDWLILAGDIAERFEQGEQTFRMLQQRFAGRRQRLKRYDVTSTVVFYQIANLEQNVTACECLDMSQKGRT